MSRQHAIEVLRREGFEFVNEAETQQHRDGSRTITATWKHLETGKLATAATRRQPTKERDMSTEFGSDDGFQDRALDRMDAEDFGPEAQEGDYDEIEELEQ